MNRSSLSQAIVAAIVLSVATPAGAQAGDRTERLLAELADAPGPPGFEEDVRRIVVREGQAACR